MHVPHSQSHFLRLVLLICQANQGAMGGPEAVPNGRKGGIMKGYGAGGNLFLQLEMMSLTVVCRSVLTSSASLDLELLLSGAVQALWAPLGRAPEAATVAQVHTDAAGLFQICKLLLVLQWANPSCLP